ncbi:MAG: peptide-methionine (S)-S-oxide reductase MsrA [Acidobacteriaceae bacterium]
MITSAGKHRVPAPLVDAAPPAGGWPPEARDRAVFAGGCFWGVQSVFQRVKGVLSTTVGYSGGSAETANYQAVCTQNTGHAEAIDVLYNPSVVTYGTLLRVFFSVVHDPTQLNRQGGDIGPSYRSAIFYTSEEQRAIAQSYVQQLDATSAFAKPIVTQIVPLKDFFAGEQYHQDYAIKNPHNPYIQVCDIPKIGALKAEFPELFQEYRP